FIGADGNGETSAAVAALNYCAMLRQRGVNIVLSNNSWGDNGFSTSLYQAMARNEAAGMLFVAAAGNDRQDNDSGGFYPATYDLPNIISVASTNSTDALARTSNYGAKT